MRQYDLASAWGRNDCKARKLYQEFMRHFRFKANDKKLIKTQVCSRNKQATTDLIFSSGSNENENYGRKNPGKNLMYELKLDGIQTTSDRKLVGHWKQIRSLLLEVISIPVADFWSIKLFCPSWFLRQFWSNDFLIFLLSFSRSFANIERSTDSSACK